MFEMISAAIREKLPPFTSGMIYYFANDVKLRGEEKMKSCRDSTGTADFGFGDGSLKSVVWSDDELFSIRSLNRLPQGFHVLYYF